MPGRRVVLLLTALVGVAEGAAPRGADDLPGEAADGARSVDPGSPSDEDAAAIEAQPVCVGSTVHSAGELGPALLYRRALRADGRLEVGYYAFFSEERPWGNNWLTWSLLPALGVDLVYTRALLVAPGLQRAMFGRADVEGFRVLYTRLAGGGLRVEGAVADDDGHHRRDLSPADLYAADPARITLASETWSHHLGARIGRPGDLVYRRCYGPRSIRPIDRDVVQRFNLEHRAWPAIVGDGAAMSARSGADDDDAPAAGARLAARGEPLLDRR